MAIYKDAEIKKGSNVIRANVEVDGFVPITGPSAGRFQWSGILRPPNNTGLVVGDIYTLVLPEFPPARIEIADEANPVDGSVPFKGIGELPVKPPRQVQNRT